jgi:hypothetical protein
MVKISPHPTGNMARNEKAIAEPLLVTDIVDIAPRKQVIQIDPKSNWNRKCFTRWNRGPMHIIPAHEAKLTTEDIHAVSCQPVDVLPNMY